MCSTGQAFIAVGKYFGIAIDFHGRVHKPMAKILAKKLEPIDADNPLLKLDNVIITPHIGMYSKEAINAVSLICAENVAAMFQGGTRKFRVV
mgnify:CR=1 FL=1